MSLLQAAMVSHIGSFGTTFVAIILFLFSFSTFLGILFYAKSNVAFLMEGQLAQNIYKAFAIVMIFAGGLNQYLFVWGLADMGVGLMTFINLFAIVPLCKIALESLEDYELNYMSKGALSPKKSTL